LFWFGQAPGSFMHWIIQMLSWSFIFLLASLVTACMFCVFKIMGLSAEDGQHISYWQQIGLQSSSAIATLALTYTLLGISMGIGSLSGQEMSAETVNQIISDLTRQFSMAFMTSVVGLPLSAAFRTILIVAPLKPQPRSGDKTQTSFAPLTTTES